MKPLKIFLYTLFFLFSTATAHDGEKGKTNCSDCYIPNEASSPTPSYVSGRLTTGYLTQSVYRGLLVNDNNPNIPIILDWRSDLNETYSLILELGTEIYPSSSVGLNDEQHLDIGIQRKWDQDSCAALSCRSSKSGVAGLFAKDFFHHDSRTHEFAFMLRQQISFLPFYLEANGSYSFAGVTGWWFEASLASHSRLTEDLSMSFRFGNSLSSGYISGANGWQARFIQLSLAHRLGDHLFIEPGVGAYWLGSGAHRLNARYGSSLFRGNRWSAGIRLLFEF